MKPTVIVSDHALLRYLERIIGLDVEQYRARLAADLEGAAALGARSLTIDGATFILAETPNGAIVIPTVLTDKMRRSARNRVPVASDGKSWDGDTGPIPGRLPTTTRGRHR